NEQPLSQYGRRSTRDPFRTRERLAFHWNVRWIPTCSGRVCAQCFRAHRCRSRRVLAQGITETDQQTDLLACWTGKKCKNGPGYSGASDIWQGGGNGSV